MADYTIICRSSDGLPLVEVWDSRINLEPVDSESAGSKRDIQAIKMNTRVICRKLPSNDTKCTIIEDDLCYHYIVEGGVCYMNITNSSYPKKLAFIYLAELCQTFVNEVNKQSGQGTNFSQVIRSIEKPYHFINFDRIIHKMRTNFKNPNSSKALSMINNSLTEVTNIMKKNIDEILNRGENLEDIGRMADGLRMQTEMFKISAKKLSRDGLLKKYVSVYIGVLIIFLIFLYYKVKRSSQLVEG